MHPPFSRFQLVAIMAITDEQFAENSNDSRLKNPLIWRILSETLTVKNFSSDQPKDFNIKQLSGLDRGKCYIQSLMLSLETLAKMHALFCLPHLRFLMSTTDKAATPTHTLKVLTVKLFGVKQPLSWWILLHHSYMNTLTSTIVAVSCSGSFKLQDTILLGPWTVHLMPSPFPHFNIFTLVVYYYY